MRQSNPKCEFCRKPLRVGEHSLRVFLIRKRKTGSWASSAYLCSEKCLRTWVCERIRTSRVFQKVNYDRWSSTEPVRFFRNRRVTAVLIPMATLDTWFLVEDKKLLEQY